MKLENKGETMIGKDDVHIKLRGVDPTNFGVEKADFEINPQEDVLKNDINPDTGEAINSPPVFVTFETMNYESELSGNTNFPLFVDVCYLYKTKATSKLCIKEDPLDRSDDICTIAGSKEVQNSGAPVQITKFEEYSAGQNAVSFSFTVKNVGNGLLSTPLRPSAQGDDVPEKPCSQESPFKNVVKVKVVTGMDNLSCSGMTNPVQLEDGFEGFVKLTTGERQVRCTQNLDGEDQVDKIMIVDFEVDYHYEESKSTTVLVKHI
jgi:hypothetical protein